jgi:putative nucleotidyltransferase with HDIG domain
VLNTQERIEQLVGNLDTIATLPEVVARITATVNDPNSTAADLHRIISHDPALVTRLLKLVNSAFYARSTEIDSVERAVVLLGFETVHHLAIAATMGRLFKGVKICEGFTARDLWNHCIAVAVVAREMARQIRQETADEVFLAGLVHDVGILVSLQVCRGRLRQVCEKAKAQSMPFSMLELDVIGVDHQELGAALASRWGFPHACRIVARYHHHPSLADGQWQTAAAIVHAADTLCCQAGVGFNLTAVNQMADETAFKGLVPMRVIDSANSHLHELVEPALKIFA